LKVFGPNTKRLPDEFRGGAAALGFFDGVHLGHARLIGEAMEIAKQKGRASMVYTFHISPRNFGGTINVLEITPLNEKTKVLETFDLDAVFVDKFDENIKNMTGEEFVREILHEKLGVTHVVVGFNYRFGVKASCGGDELREYCAKYGIGVTQLPPFYASDSTPVSSTLIRSLIVKGEVEEAWRLLGRPFFIQNSVIRGQQIGSVMDVKTINQEFVQHTVRPPKGVYVTRTTIDGKYYRSMTNVGTRPTVNDGDDVRVETHIMGFNSDIYGKNVKVEFLKFIRDEKKFENLEALKAQLMRDTKTTHDYFEKTLGI